MTIETGVPPETNSKLNSKIPAGRLQEKWDNHKNVYELKHLILLNIIAYI